MNNLRRTLPPSLISIMIYSSLTHVHDLHSPLSRLLYDSVQNGLLNQLHQYSCAWYIFHWLPFISISHYIIFIYQCLITNLTHTSFFPFRTVTHYLLPTDDICYTLEWITTFFICILNFNILNRVFLKVSISYLYTGSQTFVISQWIRLSCISMRMVTWVAKTWGHILC
jgi:hypothetical protein